MKTQIYHNNRCSKSRECLALMPSKDIEIVDYINNPLTKDELKALLKKLGMKASELVRRKEPIWLEKYKDQKMSEARVLTALAKHPRLIERPVVVKGEKAVVCRPPEKVLEFLT